MSDTVSGSPNANDIDREIRRMTRRSFATGAVAAAAGIGGWSWLQTREPVNGIPWPFRRVLEFNEKLSRRHFSAERLSPTFPKDLARDPRANGTIGLAESVDVNAWRIEVQSDVPRMPVLNLSVADIAALPKVEMVAELKCVEGWSEIVHWTGARFRDFMTRFRFGARNGLTPDLRRPDELFDYVGMTTPNHEYYVGIDMAAACHPQTMLCYAMNGTPLSPEHGGPLRLATPTKYGIKNIKQIGSIRFSDVRPADYWAERGYDWYAGH